MKLFNDADCWNIFQYLSNSDMDALDKDVILKNHKLICLQLEKLTTGNFFSLCCFFEVSFGSRIGLMITDAIIANLNPDQLSPIIYSYFRPRG